MRAADHRFARGSVEVEDTYEAFLSVPLISGGDVLESSMFTIASPHYQAPEEVSPLTFAGKQMGVRITKSFCRRECLDCRDETAEMRPQLETRKVVERASRSRWRRDRSQLKREAFICVFL